MGRADPTNSTQYNQGQAPETIDDAPPPPPFESNDDLYGPPTDPPKKAHEKTGKSTRSTVQPSNDQPQAFPPPHQDYEETPQDFPPPPSAAAEQYFHGHQPNTGMMPPQFPPQQAGFHQPPPQKPAFHHQQQYVQYQQAAPPPAFHGHAGGVPTGQPVTAPSPFHVVQELPTQPWKTGLFDCMDDPQNAVITLCFPCVTFGQIAEILDSGSTSCGTSGMWYGLIAFCIAAPCIMSCTYRTKMRSRFGLVETPAPDWLVHCCCEHCALCQEYRELKHHDFDPTIGWHGNLARQQQKQQYGMTPPMQQRMI